MNCAMPNPPKNEPVKPAKVWRVKAGVPFTAYYDGICADSSEYIAVKAR